MNKATVDLDVVKAILICMVVIDHNDFVREIFPDFFRCLNFHVIGFLTLPFMRPPIPLSKKNTFDRVIRYMVPFLVFSVPAFTMYSLIFLNPSFVIDNLIVFAWGVITGSAKLLNQSTGFSMFWFLPSLLGMVLLQSCIHSLSTPLKYLLISILFGLHFIIGLTAKNYLVFFPFGLPVVIYVFVLSKLIVILAKKTNQPLAIAWVMIFVISTYFSVTLKTATEVGFVEVASIYNIGTLIIHDLMAISGVLCVLYISSYFSKIYFLKEIGRHSLLIYLIHPFVYFGFKIIYQYCHIHFNVNITPVLLVFITFIMALMVSLWSSKMVFLRPKLKNMMVPAYFNEWLPVQFITAKCIAK